MPGQTSSSMCMDTDGVLCLSVSELQCKRTERKRRSTANPQFSYNFEPEVFITHLVLYSLNDKMYRSCYFLRTGNLTWPSDWKWVKISV